MCEHLRSITVYGSKDVTLTLEECKNLRNGRENESDRDLVFKPVAVGGSAFFSVRSFLVVFLRGSLSRHVKWAGNPDLPLEDKERMNPRASFEMFMTSAVSEFTPWSTATVELLRVVRQGFSSQLYAEGLPADVQETFAHVSHELRTPFHGVMGALEMLAAGSGCMDVDEQRDIIDSALQCGGSMMGTLNDILDIAKDRNNTEVVQGLLPPSKPILMAVAAMRPFAATEKIELVHDTDNRLPDEVHQVVGDERRIKAIVQNLVNNAIKFTPSGGRVRVFLVVLDALQDVIDWWIKETERFGGDVWMGSPETGSNATTSGSSRPPTWHVYCIEDSGIGVLPADLPHLVTAYKQVSHGPAKSHAGTGLGLHICKAHVDAMSGALGIASTFSEEASSGGTLFAVVLPLCPAEVASAAQKEEDAAAAVATVKSGTKTASSARAGFPCCPDIGSRKIAFLVVDDNNVNIKLISHKIRRYFKSSNGDVQVLSATNGLAALDMHAAARTAQADPDAPVLIGIFVDFCMPEVDGIQCTERVRILEAAKRWRRIPIYGCTADATVQKCGAFRDAGADGVLPKPWDLGKLEGLCNAMVASLLDAEQEKIEGGKA